MVIVPHKIRKISSCASLARQIKKERKKYPPDNEDLILLLNSNQYLR